MHDSIIDIGLCEVIVNTLGPAASAGRRKLVCPLAQTHKVHLAATVGFCSMRVIETQSSRLQVRILPPPAHMI